MGVGGQCHAPAAFTSGKDPVPIVQEAGWAPGLVWIGAENLAPTRFQSRTFQPTASRYTNYAIPAYMTKSGYSFFRYRIFPLISLGTSPSKRDVPQIYMFLVNVLVQVVSFFEQLCIQKF